MDLNDDFRQRLSVVVNQARGDMNQRDFGAKLAVSQATVVGWERGQNIPTLENLFKLAALRGQLPEELLAELCGRSLDNNYPLEERVKIMTKTQLLDLLSTLSTQISSKLYND